MYSMKEVCELTNLTYETLKYYCNEGLIPNVKRDERNYRVFDSEDVLWIQSLSCLKKCGMKITEMKHYVELCMVGNDSIKERKQMLHIKKEALLEKRQQIEESLLFIEEKQKYYDEVLSKEKVKV